MADVVRPAVQTRHADTCNWRLQVTAFCATLKVLPLATLIGWPVNGPYHDRVPVLDVRSSDAIDHVLPDPFVHDRPPDTFGSVTFDPADDAVDAVVIDVPPAV